MQAEEVVDKAVKEAINKPWLPLPIGLKPPSMDSVLDELSKQGIPFSKKSKGSRPCWLVVHDSNGSHQTVLVTVDGGGWWTDKLAGRHAWANAIWTVVIILYLSILPS
jgi:hypothetical protein